MPIPATQSFLWRGLGGVVLVTFKMEAGNKFTKRRLLHACSHAHFLSNDVKKWDVFVSTHQQTPKGPCRHSGLLSSGGNLVHLLFPLLEQDRCKSWACWGEVQPILGHKVSIPAGANGGEERRSREELKGERIQ